MFVFCSLVFYIYDFSQIAADVGPIPIHVFDGLFVLLLNWFCVILPLLELRIRDILYEYTCRAIERSSVL